MGDFKQFTIQNFKTKSLKKTFGGVRNSLDSMPMANLREKDKKSYLLLRDIIFLI